MPLPFARKEQLDLAQTGDELVVQVGDYKRNLILPRALAASQIEGARLEDGELRITFVRPEAPAKPNGGESAQANGPVAGRDLRPVAGDQ